MAGEFDRQVPVNIDPAQKFHAQFAAMSMRFQLLFDRKEWMFGQEHVRWSECRDDQNSQSVEAGGQIIEHVHGREIGPR